MGCIWGWNFSFIRGVPAIQLWFIVPFLKGIFIKVQVQWTLLPITPNLLGMFTEVGCCKSPGRFGEWKANCFSLPNMEERGWYLSSPVSYRGEVFYPAPCFLMYPPELWRGGGETLWKNCKSHPFSVFVLFRFISSKTRWKMKSLECNKQHIFNWGEK